jgi:hypothetical protein
MFSHIAIHALHKLSAHQNVSRSSHIVISHFYNKNNVTEVSRLLNSITTQQFKTKRWPHLTRPCYRHVSTFRYSCKHNRLLHRERSVLVYGRSSVLIIPTDAFRGFSHSLQENSVLVPQWWQDWFFQILSNSSFNSHPTTRWYKFWMPTALCSKANHKKENSVRALQWHVVHYRVSWK